MIRCLSVHQPYAWAIIHGCKPIENRSRRCHIRERVLIHASLMGPSLRQRQSRFASVLALLDYGTRIPLELQCGGIIGSVEIVGCTDRSASRWFTGPWGWELAEPKPLEFIQCKGAQGFFRAPQDVLDALALQGKLDEVRS